MTGRQFLQVSVSRVVARLMKFSSGHSFMSQLAMPEGWVGEFFEAEGGGVLGDFGGCWLRFVAMAFAGAQEVAEDGIADVPYFIPACAGGFAPCVEPVAAVGAFGDADDAVEIRVALEERRGQRARDDGDAGIRLHFQDMREHGGAEHGVADAGGGDEEDGALRHGPLLPQVGQNAKCEYGKCSIRALHSGGLGIDLQDDPFR
jgi:hypothetical protein